VEVVAKSRFPWAPTGGLIAPDGDLWLLESTFTNAVRARHIERFGAVGAPVEPRVSVEEQVICARTLDDATGTTEKALAAFERGGSIDVARASRVLVSATADRDRLEATTVSPSCARSRAEELLYLNHLTLGFEGWIAARSRRPPGDFDLESIVRRARTHRELGRARLR
jgi:hypothetical protein